LGKGLNAASNNDISKDKLGHIPDFEALARDIQNRVLCSVGMATTEVQHFHEFFGERARFQKNMGVAREGLPHPIWLPPKASALGPSIHEGVPQAEPGVFGCWRVGLCRQPEDPPQVDLGVH
jgi:hypothetical protein